MRREHSIEDTSQRAPYVLARIIVSIMRPHNVLQMRHKDTDTMHNFRSTHGARRLASGYRFALAQEFNGEHTGRRYTKNRRLPKDSQQRGKKKRGRTVGAPTFRPILYTLRPLAISSPMSSRVALNMSRDMLINGSDTPWPRFTRNLLTRKSLYRKLRFSGIKLVETSSGPVAPASHRRKGGKLSYILRER